MNHVFLGPSAIIFLWEPPSLMTNAIFFVGRRRNAFPAPALDPFLNDRMINRLCKNGATCRPCMFRYKQTDKQTWIATRCKREGITKGSGSTFDFPEIFEKGNWMSNCHSDVIKMSINSKWDLVDFFFSHCDRGVQLVLQDRCSLGVWRYFHYSIIRCAYHPLAWITMTTWLLLMHLHWEWWFDEVK